MRKSLVTGVVLAGTLSGVVLGSGVASAAPLAPTQFTILESGVSTQALTLPADRCGDPWESVFEMANEIFNGC